jgi:hypothetical protein
VKEAAITLMAEATAAGVTTIRKDEENMKAEARGTQGPRMVLHHCPLARELEAEARDLAPAQNHLATGKAQEMRESA